MSSTYEDLKKDRKIVQKAILSMNCFPAGMELFPATDRSQFEYICEGEYKVVDGKRAHIYYPKEDNVD